jgi:hypothetical protein
MNERIKNLMQEAGTDTSGKWMGVDHAEKFAQLIVEECARACLVATEPGSSVHLVSVAYADAVRRHFGVE